MGELLGRFVNRPMVDTTAPLGGHKDWRSNLKSMRVPTTVSSNSILTEALESLIQYGRINRNQAVKYTAWQTLTPFFRSLIW